MFYIQAPVPMLNPNRSRTYPSVGDAMRGVIQRVTETMYWVWNGVPIAVGYGEPFGVLLLNVLGLVEACLAKPAATWPFGLREEAFVARWTPTWADGDIRIDAEWHSAPGGVEPLLRERPRIEMPLDQFLAEWKMPLRRVLHALDGAGNPAAAVTIGANDQETLARLRAAEAAIPALGWLYREGSWPPPARSAP